MWSLILIGVLVSSVHGRTTVHIPKTRIETEDSTISVEASGSITNNNVEDIAGTFVVEQAPFTVGLSRNQNKTISAILGYTREYTVAGPNNSTVEAYLDANAEINTQSSSGSLSISSPSFYGVNPEASVKATITKDGISNYGVGFNLATKGDDVQVNTTVSGNPNQGVTLQTITQIGPITGIVTRNESGLWEQKVGTVLSLGDVTLTAGLVRESDNEMQYVLGISSPVVWGKIHIDNSSVLSYYLGGVASGVQDNISYAIEATGAYLSENETILYSVATTFGPITGAMSGILYEDYSLQIKVDLYIFEVAFNVGVNGNISYYFDVNLNDANVMLLLDENFEPSSLVGEFWSQLFDLSAETDFQGDYNVTIQTDDLTLPV